MNRVLMLLPVFLVVLGCSVARTSADGKEIARLPSPDASVDAVLIEVPTGATVATPTELYITHKGAKPIASELVLRADYVEAGQAKWESERLLEFSYDGARIHVFRNFWRSAAVDNYAYQVEIKLKPTSIRSVK